jgi:hypothetical protein
LSCAHGVVVRGGAEGIVNSRTSVADAGWNCSNGFDFEGLW